MRQRKKEIQFGHMLLYKCAELTGERSGAALSLATSMGLSQAIDGRPQPESPCVTVVSRYHGPGLRPEDPE